MVRMSVRIYRQSRMRRSITPSRRVTAKKTISRTRPLPNDFEACAHDQNRISVHVIAPAIHEAGLTAVFDSAMKTTLCDVYALND